jgi:hypothetical protein
VGSAAGKDASDHLHNGYGLADFIAWTPPVHRERRASAPQGATPSGAVAKRSEFALVPATSVRRQKRRWLIPGLLPLGAVTGCNGEEKAGKSIYAAHLVGLLSKGALGDDGPQSSLIVAYEDDQPEWIARLQGAGADLDRVNFLLIKDQESDRDLVLPHDMEAFDQAVAATRARLVVIDPITDSVDMSLDTAKRQHVKLVARKLKAVADHHGIAILAINHWNRSQGSSARDRVADSIAWRQSFRSNIGFFIHPDKPTHRVVAQTGTNWAKGGEQYWFELKEVMLPYDPATGEPEMGVPVVIDLAPVPESARLDEHTLFAGPKADKKPTERDEATKWLRQFLMDGPKKKSEITQFAAFEGIKARTLDRAADELYVNKDREYDPETGKTISIWRLPAIPTDESEDEDR